ncbi:IclR family transcriptional regulator C-terminal domain-containing protein, partial [Escherichia coli]|nr:IclR family transcriptional regulator C-terminal domain-containing protein [Escherichia coli]
LMRVDPRERRHFVPPSGVGVPVHGSSIGKAILAEMPIGEVCRAIEPAKLTPLTEKTLVAEGDLLRDIGHSHRRGFALDDEENTIGL